MSETETETTSFNLDDGVLRREFAAELTAGEGRTVDVRIVPYGERITHNDGLGPTPRGVDYQEEWLPGVFAHQVNAANRVVANWEHQRGIEGIIGHGLALRETADGFHGSFKLHETPDGDKVLMMVNEGVVDGVSLEAQPVRNVTKGGLVQRAKANLRAVAFTRFAAYSGAKILAVREEQFTLEPEQMPAELNDEVVARCQRLGIKLPQRYEAHPDETGTPLAGTPELGTRQDREHSDLEDTGDANAG